MLPEELRRAAALVRSEALPVTPAPDSGSLGTVSVAATRNDASSPVRRIVVVIDRDVETDTATIQLVTNATEAATHLDLIVHAGEAGTPYEFVVQTELYGPVYTDQLEAGVGQLGTDAIRAVRDALRTDGESLERFPTGIPLSGSDDPRRRFKHQELIELDRLVESCRSFLSGAAAEEQTLDPQVLLPPPRGTSRDDAVDQFLELLDVLREVGRTRFPSELLALFGEAGLIDELARWRTDFMLDAARIMSHFAIEDTGTELPPAELEGPLAQPASASVVLERYVAVLADSGVRSVDVMTSQRFWAVGPAVRPVRSHRGRTCRIRSKLVEAS